MSGKITFHFDDGFSSHYEKVFRLFEKYGFKGCIALLASFRPVNAISVEQALRMQEAGWEILSHSVEHKRMSQYDAKLGESEITLSKQLLEAKGFVTKAFVTPMSECHPLYRPLLQANYDAAFTSYTNSKLVPIEKLVIKRPINCYELNRACMSGKSIEELKEYVDYVLENDAWLNLYDHDIAVGENVTEETLEELLLYCRSLGVEIVTVSEAIAKESCLTKIISDGYDGKSCKVHVRGAVHNNEQLLTGQYLNIAGCDDFNCLHFNYSSDGGKTWSGFKADTAFLPEINDGIRTVASDMTPLYHKRSERFIVTGHTVNYFVGENRPVPVEKRKRCIPYAVFDTKLSAFGKLKKIEMPDSVKYFDCGSGCSQCYELDNGELLIPISFREEGTVKTKVTVIRCSFDGEEIKVLSIGNDLEVKDSARGIGEASVIFHDGRYYLTIRDDSYGYIAVSDDGENYSQPEILRWTDGEIVPTYNTQSHWFVTAGRLYLVYTRKASTNNHVFRHRAPLFAAEFDAEKRSLKKQTEFVVVPERGARLGNFGVCSMDDGSALVIASEWMQPAGCEKYGSNNAVWVSKIVDPDEI